MAKDFMDIPGYTEEEHGQWIDAINKVLYAHTSRDAMRTDMFMSVVGPLIVERKQAELANTIQLMTLARKVEAMRKLQIRFFNGDKSVVGDSKILEKEVDAILKVIKLPPEPNVPVQPKMF